MPASPSTSGTTSSSSRDRRARQRATRLSTTAKQLIPGKPIRYVVNTHHHFDHSSGLRTFVAEGATVVTHEVNKPYFEKLFALPHTLTPDRLQQEKRAPKFETMTEKKVLTDGNHVIELHHISGSGHNEGLIVAYLPKEKILVEADAFNPPPQPPMAAPPSISPYTHESGRTHGSAEARCAAHHPDSLSS